MILMMKAIHSNLTHKQLVQAAYKWLIKNGKCGIAFKELVSTAGEIPDAIGFCCWRSVMIECKVTRSDFLKDKKKIHRAKGMGTYRLYCCPTGLIKLEELPPKWGLLYVSEKQKITCAYHPETNREANAFEKDFEAEQKLLYSALRRLFVKGLVSTIYDKAYARGVKPTDIFNRNS